MIPDDLQRAWVRKAQVDSERGVIACRMCQCEAGLDRAVTLWRNGALVFAVCDRCASAHDILMQPTDAGIEVRPRQRAPFILRGAAS